MYAYNSRPGDWTCANCHYVNFATRRECKRCNITKGNQASGFSSEDGDGSKQQHWRSNARGARFGERSEDRGNGQKSGSTPRSGQRKKREYPMGYKALEKMLEEDSDQIVMQLLRESSGYDLLLEKTEEISEDKMCLLMQVLVRATGTRANREGLNIVMTKTFQSKFNNHLLNFALTIFIKDVDHCKVFKYFENLSIVLDKVAHAMPNLAMDKVFVLVEGCLMCLKQRVVPEFSEVIAMYEETKSFLELEKKKWQSQNENGARRGKGSWQDNLQPPENFRGIPIIPTVQELNDPEKPFLRRNIVKGRYDDIEHYLDVQFRLLREDFIRPLRNGIQEFKGDIKSRNRDLFIYKDISIVGADVKHFNLIHNVKLNLPKNFKVENSKRLLFGNLVCLSCDNFKTVLFGSVSERNPEMLKKGLLGIKFDSEVKNARNEMFVMAESKSYFTAYKHVLKALQRITEDTFPMEEFIVHVNSDMPFPTYLHYAGVYDLQVIRNKYMMKESEVNSDLFQQRQREFEFEQEHLEVPALRRVNVTRDLHDWPSCEDLQMDESQRRALRSALTSKLTIIQGPPGTGKTFLGLKIAQALLHNSEYWKMDGENSPILVVCFTNHALDQFLEGMLPFTRSLARVGSRTKSEIIADYQINSLVRSLRSRRVIPNEIHQNHAEMMQTLNQLEVEVKSFRQKLENLREPHGILKLSYLLSQNVIPDRIAEVFQRHKLDLEAYLLDPRFVSSLGKTASGKPYGNQKSNKQRATFKDMDEDEDFWQDAEDFLAEEEDARRLDDDFGGHQDTYRKTGDGLRYFLGYSISLQGLENEIQNLREKRDSGSVVDVLQYERKIIELEGKLNLLEYGLNIPFAADRAEALERYDITTLDVVDRWMLYKLWLHKIAEVVAHEVAQVEDEFERNAEAFNEIKDQQYLHVMRNVAVVGMTTTGAAQYSNVLHALHPSIVIIEEAAEILEAHVITALTEKCQHLIMIGDHQQLQPSATVYELATKYGLETSLFERLIKNDVAFETLEYQHRMRPNISRLLVPSIYENLKDHESVHLHPHVKGLQRDVYFINHKQLEKKAGDDNSSKENMYEAELIMALCRHLMLQGYSKEDITVLTPYSGQFFLLKKIQRKYEECTGVRISVVDNFQGEESNIILLSLVRSNEEGAVGFLRTENRICVALSRARHGLYVTGNMRQLENSCDLWKTICSDLRSDDSIGSSLCLQCDNHPEVLSSVTTGDDILEKSPEGGCRKPCSSFLPKCGHKCPKICHMADLEHAKVKCPLPCPKILCERNHPCLQKCWEDCRPCVVQVPKTFPCGHVHKVACSKYNFDYKCPTVVQRELPDCQHVAAMKCYEDPSIFPCPIPCEIRLPCGHKCTRKCHVKDDPDHVNFQCEQACPRSPEGCSQEHKCDKACYEACGPCIMPAKKKAVCGHIHDVHCSTPQDNIICNRKCKRLLPCEHHCPRKCKDPCGGCTVKVKKIIPDCKHEIEVECGKPAAKTDCSKQCTLPLPCGHQCQARCKEPCTTLCKAGVLSNMKCPKGHKIKVPCYLLNMVTEKEAWIYCEEPCGTELDCKHYCKGKCGHCLHGRLHMACSEKCERTLVCGHICKADCSSACPPCQAPCPMRCMHSRCGRKCGEPCSPCQEKCSKGCSHQKCSNPCWKPCTQALCEKPCPKKLKCRHPCVGYCGDPCPPLCRICDKDDLTEILFGSEDEDDARFVLLEDCGHVIEAEGLQGWLSQDSGEIGMKFCPRCKKPIYNNRRNHDAVLKTYENVRAVKAKYYDKKPKQAMQEINELLEEMETLTGKEVDQIKSCLPKATPKHAQQIYHTISDSEISLYRFQVQVVKKITTLHESNPQSSRELKSLSKLVKKRVMEQKLRIAPQMVEEITCEVQRLNILPVYWQLNERVIMQRCPELMSIKNTLDLLMDPTIRFDKEQERKVKRKLKESEQYVGGLGITDNERLEILKAMDLKQGHWYKCPNGHIYCITECGGAMVEAKCPDCGADIGGGQHTLRRDNAVATEMDGARHAVWSNHYNDMGNFNLDN